MDFIPIINSIEKEIAEIKHRQEKEINDLMSRQGSELTSYNIILKEAKKLSSGIKPETDNLMGVRWYKNQPDTKLERLGMAVGKSFKPATILCSGYSDFDKMPIYRDIKPCVMINGKVVKYLNDLRDAKIYGGDIMVEIPKFYYRFDKTDKYVDIYISDTYFNGSHISPLHDRINKLDKAYIGVYTSNSQYSSQSGCDPLTNKSINDFRKGHSNKGIGYSTWDFAAKKTIEILYLIEVADTDSQGAVGRGNVSSLNIYKSGLNNNMRFHSGCADTDSGVRYRWMENLWGNVYQFVDGVLFKGNKIYICTDPKRFSDCITSDYTELSYHKASEYGRIKSFGFDDRYPWAFCPDKVYDDDVRKYICDYYCCTERLSILITGGACLNGSSAGLFLFFCYYSPSYSSWYISSRLSYTG